MSRNCLLQVLKWGQTKLFIHEQDNLWSGCSSRFTSESYESASTPILDYPESMMLRRGCLWCKDDSSFLPLEFCCWGELGVLTFLRSSFNSHSFFRYFDFSLYFTTTAMWLWPFWNSFRMSYRGISSPTLFTRFYPQFENFDYPTQAYSSTAHKDN